MKQVQIKTKFGELADYIQLKTINDVHEYMEHLGHDVSEAIAKLIRSDIMPENWDHVRMSGSKGGVLRASVMTAYVKETNPLYEIDSLIQTKLMNMMKEIVKGEVVLVNMNGGYCTFSEDYHTILCEVEFDDTPKDTSVINKNTKYINLENDPELEKRTIEYLSQQDKNYSYVLNLRNYDVAALTEIFKSFVQNGGEVVYVYTTGLDVQQMFDYSEALIAAGIKHVEFEFNCGKHEKHDEVIKYLNDHDVNVKTLDF